MSTAACAALRTDAVSEEETRAILAAAVSHHNKTAELGTYVPALITGGIVPAAVESSNPLLSCPRCKKSTGISHFAVQSRSPDEPETLHVTCRCGYRARLRSMFS